MYFFKTFHKNILLYSVTGIPVTNLFQGGHKGTWVHRKVDYHLAKWISPKFVIKILTNLKIYFTYK
jgi:hypothetical protein